MGAKRSESEAGGTAILERETRAAPTTIEPEGDYWVGTLPNKWQYNFTVAGQDFPRITETRTLVDGETQVDRRNGRLVRLTVSRVRELETEARRRVIRTAGARVQHYRIDAPGYRPDRSDVPLSRLLYLLAVPADGDFSRDLLPDPIDPSPVGAP